MSKDSRALSKPQSDLRSIMAQSNSSGHGASGCPALCAQSCRALCLDKGMLERHYPFLNHLSVGSSVKGGTGFFGMYVIRIQFFGQLGTFMVE